MTEFLPVPAYNVLDGAVQIALIATILLVKNCYQKWQWPFRAIRFTKHFFEFFLFTERYGSYEIDVLYA